MTYWTQLWRFETANFVVTGSVAPEDSDPADSFDLQEDIDAIRDGTWEWFMVRVMVRAKCSGAELGTDYLGGCAYASASEFFSEHIRGADYARQMRAKGYSCGSYFPQMVREAIKEARSEAQSLRTRLATIHA